MNNNKPKIMVWDLETTDFKANKGHLLTACALWIDHSDIFTWRIDDHPAYGTTPESFMNDKWIVEDLVDMIAESDMLVHHYGDRFDLAFLNTRALAWDIMPAPQIRTIDTWKIARSKLAMTSNRLASLAAFLNDASTQKLKNLDISQWALAEHGDKEILDRMVEYNIGDVLATEAVYKKLRVLIPNHPWIYPAPAGADPRMHCPACGGKGNSSGSYYTKLYHVRRRRCTTCGTPWEEGRSRRDLVKEE